MRKAQFLVVFWTLFIAVPITALALSLAAYLTDNLVEISLAMQSFGQATTVGSRGWAVVLSERWPEVAGMIVGQLVILIILLIARQNGVPEEKTNR